MTEQNSGYRKRNDRPYNPTDREQSGQGRNQEPRGEFNKDFKKPSSFGGENTGRPRRPRIHKSSESLPIEKKPFRQPFPGKKGGFQKNKFEPLPVKPVYTEKINPEDETRLNKFIANAGVCSRRKADELIVQGQVVVNGVTVTELGHRIKMSDEVKLNGKILKREQFSYILLNKPKDYITTTDDPQERKTVMSLVKTPGSERIYPVGRLDRNTTGLLLLTNDGELAQKLAHPSHSVQKLYHVYLNKNLTKSDFEKLESGIELEDGLVKIDEISYVEGKDKNEIGLMIHVGKNRIVRRLFESLGYDVTKLDRVMYAGLTKKDLPRGRWRYLSDQEVRNLKFFTK